MARVKRLVSIVVVALLLAGCGAPAQPPTAIPPSAAPATPTSAPTPVAGARPRPTLLTDRVGEAAELTPTAAEIAAARAAIGNGLIGIVACTLSTEYHSIVAADAQARAESLGFRVEVFDSQAKADTQPAAIKDFASRGARVIAICVLDPKLAADAVKAAEHAGVLIVQFAGDALEVNGITIGGGKQGDIDLGCAAGEIAGDLIAGEKGGKANVAILDYPALPQIVLRADSIERCLKAKAAGATVVGRYLGGTTDNGASSMQTALKAHPEIDAVVSINDAGAYGALSALQAAGKDPKSTIVVGIDGESRAKALIKQGGFYRGSVDTSPGATGELVINAAVKLLASAAVPKSIRVPVTKITAETLK